MAEHEVRVLSRGAWPDHVALNQGWAGSSAAAGACTSTTASRTVAARTSPTTSSSGAPAELPNIHHRTQYDAETVAPPDWRTTCIRVAKSHRKRGYGRAALRGALDLIAAAGGGVVEGYPHDMATRDPAKKMSDSFLYDLTRTAYEDAGFTYVRPKGQQNCVMTRTVEPA